MGDDQGLSEFCRCCLFDLEALAHVNSTNVAFGVSRCQNMCLILGLIQVVAWSPFHQSCSIKLATLIRI